MIDPLGSVGGNRDKGGLCGTGFAPSLGDYPALPVILQWKIEKRLGHGNLILLQNSLLFLFSRVLDHA